MFNNELKREALSKYEHEIKNYNLVYNSLDYATERLFSLRERAVEEMNDVFTIINSIANTPKEFDIKIDNSKCEIEKYESLKKITWESNKENVRAVAIITGNEINRHVSKIIAPELIYRSSTTFGEVSTNKAFSFLKEIGTTNSENMLFSGFLFNQSVGIATKAAFLSMAAPMGFGSSLIDTGLALFILSEKNKKTAKKIIDKSAMILSERKEIEVTRIRIDSLYEKIDLLFSDIEKEKERFVAFKDANYLELAIEDQLFLGTMVNNTQSLTKLLNEKVM